MDYTTEIACAEFGKNERNLAQTSLTFSILYEEIRSLCAQTSLFTENWSDLHSWASKSIWTQFGLGKHYDLFNFVTITAPLLLPNLDKMDGVDSIAGIADELHDVVHIHSKRNCSDQKYEFPEVTQSAFDSFDLQLLESARIALGEHTGETSVGMSDLLAIYQNPNHPICQKSLGADFLRYALQALILNEKVQDGEVVKPLENPALRDLYDFLARQNSVPALAVMFGIALMDKLFQPEICGEQNTMIRECAAMRFSLNFESIKYHKTHGKFDMSPEEMPKTHGDMIALEDCNFSLIVKHTDIWTIGLRFAQVVGLCHMQTTQYLVASKSDFTLLGFACTVEYLVACSGEKVPESLQGLLDYLRDVVGWSAASTSVDAVISRHKFFMRARDRAAGLRRTEVVKNNPRCSLVQILIENEYRLSNDLVSKLEPNIASDKDDIIGKVQVIDRALLTQLKHVYCPLSLYTSAKFCLPGLSDKYKRFWSPTLYCECPSDIDVLKHSRPTTESAQDDLAYLSETLTRLMRLEIGVWGSPSWTVTNMESEKSEELCSLIPPLVDWGAYLQTRPERVSKMTGERKDLSGLEIMKAVDDSGCEIQERLRLKLGEYHCKHVFHPHSPADVDLLCYDSEDSQEEASDHESQTTEANTSVVFMITD